MEEMEGLNSVMGSSRLQFVSSLWIELLELLKSDTLDSQRQLVMKILQIFECREISITLTCKLICKLTYF